MKNRVLYTIILILLAFSFSGISVAAEKAEKKSVNEFIEYLKINKDSLGYESFGSFEHEDQIEVRIYCKEEAKNRIENSIKDFNYKNIEYKNHTTATGVLYVLFDKVGSARKTSLLKVKTKCPRKVPVKIESVKSGTIKEYKDFENTLSDGGKTSIISPVNGRIATVLLNSGEKIEVGDIILRFDTSGIDKQIRETQGLIKQWQVKLRKRKGWKVRSPRAEQQAQRKIDEFELKLSELRSMKERSALSSNVSGQILTIADEGTEISKGDEIASVLDNSEMKMEISTDDMAIFEGVTGLKVKVGEKGIYSGRVKREGKRLFLVIPNEKFDLSSSDKAAFRLLYKVYKDVPVLEESVIHQDANGKYIYSPVKKRARKVYIKTGSRENGKTMITSGLSVGDSVIVTDSKCIKDGKKIKVIQGNVTLKKQVKKKKREKKKKPEKKKAEKKAERKIIRKNPEPESDEIRYVEKKRVGEWDEFDNCPSVAKVTVRKLESGSVYGSKEFKSYIKSGLSDLLKSEISGRISNVLHSKGDTVQKGDILAEFDTNDLGQRVSEKERQLSQWKKVLSDILSWSERDENVENEIKAKIDKISGEIAVFRHNIDNSKLLAPAKGTVEFIVKAGDTINKGDVIAEIVEKNRVTIPVDLKDILADISNPSIEVYFEGINDKYTGKIADIQRKKDVVVFDPHNRLSPGMKAVVKISGTFTGKIVLSNGELLKDSSGYFAYVAKGDRAEKRALKILSFGKGKVAVGSGLNVGEELIVTNLECLENNKKIKAYIYDRLTGKRVFLGKKSPEEIKREKIEKKKFALGIGGANVNVRDPIFKDVYGNAGFAGMFTLSFRPVKNIDVFFNVLYLAKTGSTLSVSKVDLSMYEFNLGVRYLFGRNGKMLPFLGLALNSLAVKEKSDEINLDTPYKTSTGATFLGGAFFEITPGWDLLIDVRYDTNKMKAGENLDDINFSGIRALVGIIFRF